MKTPNPVTDHIVGNESMGVGSVTIIFLLLFHV